MDLLHAERSILFMKARRRVTPPSPVVKVGRQMYERGRSHKNPLKADCVLLGDPDMYSLARFVCLKVKLHDSSIPHKFLILSA